MLCQTAAVLAPTAGGNLGDLVREAARRAPAHRAVVHETGERTWAELDADVDAAAAGLAGGLRLRPGDRVALALPNTPAFVTAYFGLLRAGLVAVPVNTGFTSPELAGVLAEADAKAVLCDEVTLPVAEQAVAGTHRALVDGAGFDALVAEGRSAGRVDPVARGEALALLM